MTTASKATKRTSKPVTKIDWSAVIIKVFLLVGLVAVGASLGVISYRHGIHVAGMFGQDPFNARLFPAGIDGGLLVSAAAQIAPRTRASTRAAAKVAFLVCLAATLAMNGLAVGEHAGLLAMAISAVPGAIFVLTIHAALLLIKDLTRKTTEKDTLGPLARLYRSIKASRQRARRRAQAAAGRAQSEQARRRVPTEVKEATAYVKAASERQPATA